MSVSAGGIGERSNTMTLAAVAPTMITASASDARYCMCPAINSTPPYELDHRGHIAEPLAEPQAGEELDHECHSRELHESCDHEQHSEGKLGDPHPPKADRPRRVH